MVFNCLSSFNWKYQMPNSCFLIDIDPIVKIFKNLLNGSPGFVGTCFSTFSIFEILRFPRIRYRKTYLVFFLISYNNLVGPKSRIIVSGVSWTCPLVPEIMKIMIFCFWKVKVKNYWPRIILRSFWATLLLKFRVKMAFKTPADPKL